MVEPTEFRRALGAYPTGVCVVTATDEHGQHRGMVVGSFCSISLSPPLVGFFPAKEASSWLAMRGLARLCINVLGEGQGHHCARFTGSVEDRFAGLDCVRSQAGLPVLGDALAWIDITVDHIHDIGDHHLVVGAVTAMDVAAQGDPMIFFRGAYRALAPLAA